MTTQNTSQVAARDAAATWLAYNIAENERDFDAMRALVADDLAVTVNGVAAVSSADDDQEAMAALIESYPDYRREVVDVIASGTRATARWRMLGTPRVGPMPVLDVAGCSVIEVAGGVITAAHLYYDGKALDAVLSSRPER